MGQLFSKLKVCVNITQEKRVVIVGLDAAGKTTILYKLKLNQDVQTGPTMGFNIETIQYKGIGFNIWDLAGQDRQRVQWKYHLYNANGIIYVIDSNDRNRMEENVVVLDQIIKDQQLSELPLLILANKYDLQNCMSTSEIMNYLKNVLIFHQKWFLQGTSATSGEGLFEGLDWLSKSI